MSDLIRNLKKKIEAKGTALNNWEIEFYRGITTGFNDAYIISTDEKDRILSMCQSEEEKLLTKDLIRPMLRGKDILKYGKTWKGLWMIGVFPARKLDIDSLPSLKRHFLSFSIEKMEQTGKTYKIDGKTVKARKKTAGKWFETQDSIKYWEDFKKPKIIYPEITKYMPFYYEEEYVFATNTCYILSGKHISYLTAFLNSSLFKFCFKETFAVLFGGARRMLKFHFEKLPILEVDDATDEEFRTLVLDIQKEYSDEKAKAIDQRIFDLYGLTQEEREAIGYIDYHNNNDNEPDEDE